VILTTDDEPPDSYDELIAKSDLWIACGSL